MPKEKIYMLMVEPAVTRGEQENPLPMPQAVARDPDPWFADDSVLPPGDYMLFEAAWEHGEAVKQWSLARRFLKEEPRTQKARIKDRD